MGVHELHQRRCLSTAKTGDGQRGDDGVQRLRLERVADRTIDRVHLQEVIAVQRMRLAGPAFYAPKESCRGQHRRMHDGACAQQPVRG